MLIFLKLGGSLITDKTMASTPCREKISRVAQEIFEAYKKDPQINLVIGHGSGSFGHIPGKMYNTRSGVYSLKDWAGFVEVWREARRLNQIVVEALIDAGLPVIAFPPSAICKTYSGKIISADINGIQAALSQKLIPLVNGDVTFDDKIGGTIISTEEIFIYLAQHLDPSSILLAGIEEGVWEDFPKCERLIQEITPETRSHIFHYLGGSQNIDVTGGMLAKVDSMLTLIEMNHDLRVLVFSGENPGNVYQALLGKTLGTLLINSHSG